MLRRWDRLFTLRNLIRDHTTEFSTIVSNIRQLIASDTICFLHYINTAIVENFQYPDSRYDYALHHEFYERKGWSATILIILAHQVSFDCSNMLKLVQILLDIGADPDLPDTRYKMTPLMHAIDREHWEMAAVLCEKSKDINKKDKKGNTALHRFLRQSLRAKTIHLPTLTLLLKAGADPLIPGCDGKSAIALLGTRNSNVERQLLAATQTPVPGTVEHKTPSATAFFECDATTQLHLKTLINAIDKADVDTVTVLSTHPRFPSIINKPVQVPDLFKPTTIIHRLAMLPPSVENDNMMSTLLTTIPGINVDVLDPMSGLTPLCAAMIQHNPSRRMVDVLMNYGASPTTPCRNGHDARAWVLKRPDVSAHQSLVEK